MTYTQAFTSELTAFLINGDWHVYKGERLLGVIDYEYVWQPEEGAPAVTKDQMKELLQEIRYEK